MSPFSALSSKTVFLKMHYTSMSKGIILCKFHQLHPADNSTACDARDEFGIASSVVKQVPQGLTYKNVVLVWKDVFLLAGEI